jgi:8-oxo-dGTP diphosphatase
VPIPARRPAGHDLGDHPHFAVTVDVIVLTIDEGQLKVLLVKRGQDPYKGRWAIPGGFVHENENFRDAAERELVEETAIHIAATHLEQLHTYGEPDRDPRMRVVTVGYLALVPALEAPKAGTNARCADLVPVSNILGSLLPGHLAFDHDVILRDAVDQARTMLETCSVATAFVQEPFSLSQLRAVYEIIWSQRVDTGNFRRKVLSTPGFVVRTGERGTPRRGGGKPPDLYRAGDKVRLDPPIRRLTSGSPSWPGDRKPVPQVSGQYAAFGRDGVSP